MKKFKHLNLLCKRFENIYIKDGLLLSRAVQVSCFTQHLVCKTNMVLPENNVQGYGQGTSKEN